MGHTGGYKAVRPQTLPANAAPQKPDYSWMLAALQGQRRPQNNQGLSSRGPANSQGIPVADSGARGVGKTLLGL